MLRGMVSLEPATVTDRRYPLLFQTGETAFGKPIVDGQHPHDLFMELSVQYAHPLGRERNLECVLCPGWRTGSGPCCLSAPRERDGIAASCLEPPLAGFITHC